MSGFLNASDATISSSGFPTILPFILPESMPSGAAGMYLLDGSLGDELILENLVGGDQLTKIGQPSSNQLGVDLGQFAAYDTGIDETEAMTFVVVSDATQSGYRSLIMAGTLPYALSYPETVGFWWAGSTATLRINALNGAGAISTFSQSTSAGHGYTGVYEVNIGAFDATEFVLGRSENGVYSELSTGLAGRTVSPRTMRIGLGSPSQWFTGNTNIAFVAIYQRKLTGTERASAAASLRAYFAKAGINTL